MATVSKGSFSLNLGFITIGGELSEEDRQCAWELYTEIVTRLAVNGRDCEELANQFEGEVYAESFSSLYSFFKEARGIMRKFPVGRIENVSEYHLGKFTCAIMNDVMRPFLEKWQGKYRHWYCQERSCNPDKTPFDIQENYPELSEMLNDWSDLRYVMREVAGRLANEYDLVQIER